MNFVWLAGNRRLLEENNVLEDVGEGFSSFIDSFSGGRCASEADCASYISTCGSEGTKFIDI